MKLISTFLFLDAANAASVTCMQSDADDSPIEMTATVTNSEIKHDLTTDSDWSCSGAGDDATCTRSWGADAFTGAGETTFDATHLILTKTVAAGCTQTNVDGVDVCIQEGHSLEFKCKYPLGETTVSGTFDVAGHDTVAQEEGVGSLKYTLTVLDADVDIGDTVNVEVEAVNKGLVFHHLQDCTVSKSGQDVSILNWDGTNNNLETVCPNVLGAAIGVSNHQDKTSFSWTAFKWSTSTQAPNDEEQQTITCTISLYQNAPTVNEPSCDDLANASEPSQDKWIDHDEHICENHAGAYGSSYDFATLEACKDHCENVKLAGDIKCTSVAFEKSSDGTRGNLCYTFADCTENLNYKDGESYKDSHYIYTFSELNVGSDDSGSDDGGAADKYYKHVSLRCPNGGRIYPFDSDVVDVHDCAELCDNTEACVAFEHDDTTGYCAKFSQCDTVRDDVWYENINTLTLDDI